MKQKTDEYWKILGVDGERLRTIGRGIELYPRVSEDVKRRFAVISRLVDHSIQDHEFMDVALEQSLIAFEMALRTRYAKETGASSEGISLKDLISWGHKKGLFSEDENAIDALRKMRNVIVHPKGHYVASYLAPEVILRTVDIINQMYGADNYQPTDLFFQLHSMPGTPLSVHFDRGSLVLQNIGKHLSQRKPSPDEWRSFWKIVDELNVWEWAPSYDEPTVCDGLGWELRLEKGDQRVASRGINAYPGKVLEVAEPTEEFSSFSKAIGTLVGKRQLFDV